jgi:hypothetical protein
MWQGRNTSLILPFFLGIFKQEKKQMYNSKLKGKIIEVYGAQWRFALALAVHETLVSQVLQGERKLVQTIKRNGRKP